MPESKLKWSMFLNEIIRGLLVLAMAGLIIFVLYSRFAGNSESFKGIIADKWINVSETQQGSYTHRIILVKTDKDSQIKLNVDAETYDRAEIGYRINRDSSGILKINSRLETE